MSKKICPSAISTIDPENHYTIDAYGIHNCKNSSDPNDGKNGKECRICLQETYPLIIACKCSGTVKYVHEECLMHWAQQLIKKNLKQQQQDGDYQQLTSIDCELCKEHIQLKIQWKDISLSFNEAKNRNQDYFWPIIIMNLLIGLVCATCVSFSSAILIMVLTENPAIDYERFKNDPYVTWSILVVSFLVGFIFLFKSIKEIHSVFIRKEFQVDGVVYKQILRNGEQEQDQMQIHPIKSMSDVKINIQSKKINTNFYDNQEDHFSFPNVNSQQQKSDVNLIIPKNASDLKIKVSNTQNNEKILEK